MAPCGLLSLDSPPQPQREADVSIGQFLWWILDGFFRVNWMVSKKSLLLLTNGKGSPKGPRPVVTSVFGQTNPTMVHWLRPKADDQQKLPPPNLHLQAPIKHTRVPCSTSVQKPFPQPRSLKHVLSLPLSPAMRARAEGMADTTFPPQA